MVSFAFLAASTLCMVVTNPNNNNNKVTTDTSSMTNPDKSPPKRLPTFRTLASSLSDDASPKKEDLATRATQMTDRATSNTPFTTDEVQGIVNSVQNICPQTYNISFEALEELLQEVAHLSHKDWTVTDANAQKLGQVLFAKNDDNHQSSTSAGFSQDERARQLLERILTEGNWDAAAHHATTRSSDKASTTPWAVLVTGVNGIRKTTSLYQEWFAPLLQEALVVPKIGNDDKDDVDANFLPTGQNSFFRQLDHMIATLCNEDFALLYKLTSELLQLSDENDSNVDPSPEVVAQYTNLKAAIFARYRTLSELLGALLLQEAQLVQSNCLMETSGKDIAMFHYVDHFFPKGYRKLALHFRINDLELAKSSVDSRMVREIQTGMSAITSEDVFDVIYSNAGGPYGSQVLNDIQADSDRVWNEVVMNPDTSVGDDWYKATIQINAHLDKPWTACAVLPDGSFGKEYEFKR